MVSRYDNTEIDFDRILSSGFDWSRVADILKALGHPVRLQIVAALSTGETHVSGLVDRLGIRQATISQHLSVLRLNEIVERTRSNGYMVYRLALPTLPDLLSCIMSCSEHDIDRYTALEQKTAEIIAFGGGVKVGPRERMGLENGYIYTTTAPDRWRDNGSDSGHDDDRGQGSKG